MISSSLDGSGPGANGNSDTLNQSSSSNTGSSSSANTSDNLSLPDAKVHEILAKRKQAKERALLSPRSPRSLLSPRGKAGNVNKVGTSNLNSPFDDTESILSNGNYYGNGHGNVANAPVVTAVSQLIRHKMFGLSPSQRLRFRRVYMGAPEYP